MGGAMDQRVGGALDAKMGVVPLAARPPHHPGRDKHILRKKSLLEKIYNVVFALTQICLVSGPPELPERRRLSTGCDASLRSPLPIRQAAFTALRSKNQST
jgi:hypothetical protein